MHIAFITTEYISVEGRSSGGLANYIYKVGKSLSSKGHKVSILCLSSRYQYWKDGPIDIYEVKRCQLKLPNKNQFNNWRNIVNQKISAEKIEKQIWNIYSSYPIDVIQVSSYKTPGYTLVKNGVIPVICRISSYSPMLRSAFGSTKSLVDCILDFMEVQQIINADVSFVPSKFMASLYSRMENYQPQVLQSPLDEKSVNEDFSLYERILKNKKYFLFFSWLNAVKGVDLIAEVMPRILEQYPDIHFVFIGGNHYLPRKNSRSLDYIYSCNTKNRDRIIYHEPISKPLLYGILINAFAVLIPSRVDNLPNACLEAFQYGIPVIGSNHSSIEEMVEDGKTGLLFENGDANSLFKALDRLLKMTQKELKHMRNNIISKTHQINSEDRNQKLINLYMKAIREYKTK